MLKKKYSLNYILKKIDRTKTTLIRWEEMGLLPRAKRDSRGWRYYSKEELDQMVNLIKTTDYFQKTAFKEYAEKIKRYQQRIENKDVARLTINNQSSQSVQSKNKTIKTVVALTLALLISVNSFICFAPNVYAEEEMTGLEKSISNFGQSVGNTQRLITSFTSNQIQNTKDLVNKTLAYTKSTASATKNKIYSIALNTYNPVKQTISKTSSNIKSNISKAMTFTKNTGNKAMTFAKATAGKAKNYLSSNFNNLKNKTISNISDTSASISDSIIDFSRNISNTYSKASNFISSIISPEPSNTSEQLSINNNQQVEQVNITKTNNINNITKVTEVERIIKTTTLLNEIVNPVDLTSINNRIDNLASQINNRINYSTPSYSPVSIPSSGLQISGHALMSSFNVTGSGAIGGSLSIRGSLSIGNTKDNITPTLTIYSDSTFNNGATFNSGLSATTLSVSDSLTSGDITASTSTIAQLTITNDLLVSGNSTTTGSYYIGKDLNVIGDMGILDADVPDTITASNYLLLTGGTLTGGLTMTTSTSTNATSTNLYLSNDLTVSNDTSFQKATSTFFYASGDITSAGNFTGDLTGNADTATNLADYSSAYTWTGINTYTSDLRSLTLHASTTDFDLLVVNGSATTTGSLYIGNDLNVVGDMGILDADVPNTITASNYLLLTGGTLTGGLTMTTSTSTNSTTTGSYYIGGTASTTELFVQNDSHIGNNLTIDGNLTISNDSSFQKATSTFFYASGDITSGGNFTGNLIGNVTGDLTGNADTATNLADYSSAYTWTGINTFSSDLRITGTLHATTTDFDLLVVNGNATTTGSLYIGKDLNVVGDMGILDADVPNTITASNYLLLTGGTLTGGLTMTTATATNATTTGSFYSSQLSSGSSGSEYYFPLTRSGSADYVLQTDINGNLSWTAMSAGEAAWQYDSLADAMVTTSTKGFYMTSSSTVHNSFRVDGNSTTTGSLYIGKDLNVVGDYGLETGDIPDLSGTYLTNLNSETFGSLSDVSTTTLAYGYIPVWDTSNWVSSSTLPFFGTEWDKLWISTSTKSGNLTIDGNATTTGKLVLGTTNPTTNAMFWLGGDSYTSGNATTTGSLRVGNQVHLDVSTVAPMVIPNTTAKVANLNADLLDGFDSSAFGDATAANQTTILVRIGTNSDSASMADSLFAGQQSIYDKVETSGPLITSSDCTTAGWQWDDTQEVCVSPLMYVTNRTTWNSCGPYATWTNGADNATCPDTLDNPSNQIYGSTVYLPQYTCIMTASTDTLVERMTAFKDFAGGVADVTTWDGLIQMGNREIDNAQHKNWSALAVADCVDGKKDLGEYYNPTDGCPNNAANCNDYSYFGEFNTRNNMLAGWAGASGSHLPMPSEYEQACTNLTLGDDGTWLWSAAVGYYNGNNWSRYARILGSTGCSSQSNVESGHPTSSFRVFLRP